jgi:DNA-binding LytR/AlgR family response regulator
VLTPALKGFPMTSRLAVVDEGLLVLMCLALDHRADPEGLAAFKTKMISTAEVSLETEGAFDFVVQMRFPTLLSFNDFEKSVAGEFRQFVSAYETSFVCKRYVRPNETEDDCLWVPCCDGHQRVDFRTIVKIKAERDYMRVHARDASWLLHSTIHKLLQVLDGRGFLHIHRSTIVNQAHVQRLIHEQRYWRIVLSDGTVESISQSHAAETIRALAELGSSNGNEPVENSDNSHRNVAATVPMVAH